jgi:hypothetical protein
MRIFVQFGWKDVNSVICIEPPPNFYETLACTMHHGRPYLFILRCLFPVWGSLDSVILCEYKIRGSPFLGRNVLMSTSCGCSTLEI